LRRALHERLLGYPSLRPAGSWRYAYEIRWLRRYPAPALPREIDGVPVKLVLIEEYPKALRRR
jgi:hypothetical protein